MPDEFSGIFAGFQRGLSAKSTKTTRSYAPSAKAYHPVPDIA